MEDKSGILEGVIVLQGRKAISPEEKNEILRKLPHDAVIGFLKLCRIKRTSLAEQVLVEIMSSWPREELIGTVRRASDPEMPRIAFRALVHKMLTLSDHQLKETIEKDKEPIASKAAQEAYNQKLDTKQRREQLGLPSNVPVVNA